MILDTYFENVGNKKLLSKEEEIELAKLIEAGDENARKHMIESNLRLAISIAKKFRNKGCPFEDLIQESNMGLIKAVDRFDWRKGYKFSTYAVWWIRQAVQAHVASHSGAIKLPTSARGVMYKAKKFRDDYFEEFGNEPTKEEIAAAVGVSPATLNSIYETSAQAVSLDKPMSRDDSGGRTFAEVVCGVDDRDPGDELDKAMIRETLIAAIKKLSVREESIIRLRFGIQEDPQNHENFPITESMKQEIIERSGK